MRRQQLYFTHVGFEKLVEGMKQHPKFKTLWIARDGLTIIEVIYEEEDFVTVIVKDIANAKSINNAGYKLVGTRYGTKLVHRLVAEAWLEKPEGKNEVNHKSHDKNDNSVENLEWCTRSENMKDAWDNGCISKPHFICRWRNGILHTKDGEIQKMNYSEYLEWRAKNGLPVYARMRKKVI